LRRIGCSAVNALRASRTGRIDGTLHASRHDRTLHTGRTDWSRNPLRTNGALNTSGSDGTLDTCRSLSMGLREDQRLRGGPGGPSVQNYENCEADKVFDSLAKTDQSEPPPIAAQPPPIFTSSFRVRSGCFCRLQNLKSD
jgi:hypothetical protein